MALKVSETSPQDAAQVKSSVCQILHWRKSGASII